MKVKIGNIESHSKWIAFQMKLRNLEGVFTILSKQNCIFNKLPKYYLLLCQNFALLHLHFKIYDCFKTIQKHEL